MKFDKFYEALNNIETTHIDSFSDLIDEEDIKKTFEETISDYKRLIKKCKHEGLDVFDEGFDKEYKTSSSIEQRREVLGSLQDQIKELLSSCDLPPKDIFKKYSDDLVSRIEKGIIDEFEVWEED